MNLKKSSEVLTIDQFLVFIFNTYLISIINSSLYLLIIVIEIPWIVTSFKIKKYPFVIFVISSFIILFSLLVLPTKGRSFLYVLTILFLISRKKDFFNVPLKKYLTAINFVYIEFLIICIINYLYILKNGSTISGVTDLNLFDTNIGNISIKTLVGFDGSTSSLDSFSGFVLLINILYFGINKVVIISAISMLLTFRGTPLVSLLFVCLVWRFFLKKRVLSRILLTNLIMYSWLIVYLIYSHLTDQLKILMFAFSHGRSLIWYQYFDFLLKDKLIYKILGYKEFIPTIDTFNHLHNNPHNTYLFILIVYGLPIYMLFNIMLNSIAVKLYNKRYAIFLYILVAGITNMQIFYLYNPIYILTLFYLYEKESD